MSHIIAFPGIEFSAEINRVAFTIFGKDIFWYALILLSGFLLGLLFVYNTSEKRGVSKDAVFDIAFWGLLVGLVCARIYYVLFDIESLDGNFWNIFKIWNGGIAIYGALIGAVMTALVYSIRHKLKPLKVFDVFVPGLLIGQIVGRWGNFVNAEVYGKATSLPWRMTINGGGGVHPLFLYESLWNVLGLVLVLIFRDKKKADGQVFFFYSLWYGVGRFFLEGMRQPQYILWLIPNRFGISQSVALLAVLVSVVMLVILGRKNKTNNVGADIIRP